MLPAFFILKLVHGTTLSGRVLGVLRDATDLVSHLVEKERAAQIEEELKLDLNRARDKWNAEKNGAGGVALGIETFEIKKEDLPSLFFDHLVGTYAFTPLEQKQVWHHISVTMTNMSQLQSGGALFDHGVDIGRLLYVGKKRLEDPYWREVAERNARSSTARSAVTPS